MRQKKAKDPKKLSYTIRDSQLQSGLQKTLTLLRSQPALKAYADVVEESIKRFTQLAANDYQLRYPYRQLLQRCVEVTLSNAQIIKGTLRDFDYGYITVAIDDIEVGDPNERVRINVEHIVNMRYEGERRVVK